MLPTPGPRALGLALACLLTFAPRAFCQTTPPVQSHVAAIGTKPLQLPASTDFAPSGNFTLEGWIYLTGNTPYAWIIGKGLATSGTDPFIAYGLQLGDDGTKLAFNVSTGGTGTYRSVTSPNALPLRTWTHVAGVMEGTTLRLLVNGQVVATGTAAGPVTSPANVPLGVGAAFLASGGTNYPAFPGYGRQFRTWTTARTAAQIAAAAGESLPSDRNGLFAAWPLDDTSGTTARDISGNNRPLTGGGAWLRLAVLDAGPFFTVTVSTPAGNVLANADDAILIDFDSDGYPDLVTQHIAVPATVPETRMRLRAFRNNRNGTFSDVTDSVLGNITMVHPRDRYVGDFNRDGRADLLIVGHGTDTPPFPGEQAKLLIQSADGRLVDETAARLPAHTSFTHNLAVGDIDGDGDLDLYLANINGGDVGPRFYLNNGSGVFTEATDRLPVDIANRPAGLAFTSAALVDVNADGRVDLVLGGENSSPVNELLLNDGTGRFARNAAFALPPKLFSPSAVTVAVTSADLNADGAPDLLLSTTGGTILMPDGRTISGYGVPGVQLLLNRGDGTFYDATTQLNLTFGSSDTWVEWIRVTDLNGDGRPDLLLQGAPTATGGSFSKTILLNRGAAVFVDASEAYTGGTVTYLQAADLDRDGLIDLIGVNSSAIVVSRATKRLDRAVFQSAPDDPGRLSNLSVRTQAGTGDQTLITGFALGGGGGSKALLVRAIGPTLAGFGLSGTLADPFVEIAPLGGAKLTENDNWGGTAALKAAFTGVGAFPLAADTSRDAALTFSPSAGAYTAKVTGVANGTGLALVEIYDSGSGNSPRLTNVSARTQVGTGGDALIVGFVVSGNVPKKLLIRAVGPTLGGFGVGGTLADPVLQLRPLGSENIVATNDDWRGTVALKSAFTSVGAFGFTNDITRDAAIAIELAPGAYTATITGKNATTGVALVEVYELPE